MCVCVLMQIPLDFWKYCENLFPRTIIAVERIDVE